MKLMILLIIINCVHTCSVNGCNADPGTDNNCFCQWHNTGRTSCGCVCKHRETFKDYAISYLNYSKIFKRSTSCSNLNGCAITCNSLWSAVCVWEQGVNGCYCINPCIKKS